jgi:hypothetical protein
MTLYSCPPRHFVAPFSWIISWLGSKRRSPFTFFKSFSRTLKSDTELSHTSGHALSRNTAAVTSGNIWN